MKIISEPSAENPFLVLSKEAGLPSAPLYEGDRSAFTEAAEIFPELYNVKGKKEIEHGLVHRIDNETKGLILIASTQEAYDRIISYQKEDKFEKWYKAKTQSIQNEILRQNGFPEFAFEANNGVMNIKSYFRPFGEKNREVRPVTDSSGKAALKKCGTKIYTTQIEFIDSETALCRITNGYRHQVRCHLAWSGNPVKGDKIYNPFNKGILEFEAFQIKFPHPYTGQILTFKNL